MIRFRCNLKGCCCYGWTIPFTSSDLMKLTRHLPEKETEQRIQSLVQVLDRDKNGEPQRFVLTPQGEERRCPFLLMGGTCELHDRYGVAALPRLCINFPAVPYSAGDHVEMYFSLVCPEVLGQLAEDEAPYRIVRLEDAAATAAADRAQLVTGKRSVTLGEVEVPWTSLEAIREQILAALADARRPVLEAVADISFALGNIRDPEDIDGFSIPRVEERQPFYDFFAESIQSHSPRILAAQLREYERFVFDLDLSPQSGALGPALIEALAGWEAPYRQWVLPSIPEWLLRRYLAHRYFTVFSSGEGTLGFSYGSIVHAFACSCRLMAGLCGALGRPVDIPIAKAAIGSAEYFYRVLSPNVPKEAFPWFRGDA